MELTKDQETKFQKLSINSLLELALKIPSSYEDYRVESSLQVAKPQVIDATIESVYRAPNSLQITFFAHNFGYTLQGVIFKPKPYMMHAFSVGQRDYFYGVIDCKMGHCTMSMPKRITQIGNISSKYRSNLRNDVMSRLVAELITKENLIQEGLKEKIADEIIALHFPNFLPSKELSEQSKHALKYLELYIYLSQLRKKEDTFKL